MSRFHPAAAAVLVLVLAACGSDRPPPPSTADSPDAAAVVARLEDDLRALAEVPPERRHGAEVAFGARLRRDLDACRGTRYENKPLYLLAQWLVVHGEDDEAAAEVLRLIDRLETLPGPAFRNAGRALRVRALLRLGRSGEARQVAEQLQRDLPEFGALAMVAFAEMVGTASPPLPGTHVAGSAPAADGFVLLAFAPRPDEGVRAWLDTFRAAASQRISVVLVACGGDMLAAAAAGGWAGEVRWLRAEDPALAAWRLPALPTSVLLGPGPQRTVLAVDVRPGDLRRLR